MNNSHLPDLSSVSSSYSDYQTGLNDCKRTGMQQTDFCDRYQSCTDQRLKDNSMCCSGYSGCESAISIGIDGSLISNSSFIRCDSITNGINITKASSNHSETILQRVFEVM